VKSFNRKLYWELRREIRTYARRDARIWKEYKRQRKKWTSRRWTLPGWFARTLWPLAVIFVVPPLSRRLGTPEFLVMLALYCTGTIFFRANALSTALYSSGELFVALHFPVSDRAFFRWQVRNWLLVQVNLFLLSSMIYSYAAAHAGAKNDEAFFYAIPFAALLQTGVVIAFALSKIHWFPKVPLGIGLVFHAMILGVVLFPGQVVGSGALLLSMLPASLVTRLFLSLRHGSAMQFAALAISILGVGVYDVLLVRALARGYPRSDLTSFLNREAQNQEDDEQERASPAPGETGGSFGRDYALGQERFAALRNREAIEKRLAQGTASLKADHWTSRLAAGWMTAREKTVAEFLSGGVSDGWRRRWKVALMLAAAGTFLCVLPLPIPFWLGGGSFILASICGAPLLGSRWPGLTALRFGFSVLQPCAGYPLGYAEVSKVMMKWNAVRLLGYTPIACTGGLLIGWRYFSSPFSGIVVGAQIMALSFALQPYFCAFQHSTGTNDTKQFNRTSALLVCVLIANVVLFVPAAIFFFSLGQSIWAWAVGLPLLFLLSVSMWWFYGYLYSRGRIDLQPVST
jgi:hypothetical protein